LKRKECKGKARIATLAEALIEAQRLNERDSSMGYCEPYPCKDKTVRPHYHVGRRKK
jgi:hypothetical protein